MVSLMSTRFLRIKLLSIAFAALALGLTFAQEAGADRLRDRIETVNDRAVTAETQLDRRLSKLESQVEVSGNLLKSIGGAVLIQILLKGVDYYLVFRKEKASAG